MTFRVREPVEILLDYQDKAELELFRQEQFVTRYADDWRQTRTMTGRIEKAKQLRANLRKIRRAIHRLQEHPETTTPEVQP